MRALFVSGFAIVALIVGGCGQDQAQSAPREKSNLKPLAIFYGQFTGRHQGKPPADEAEFKAFIKSLGEPALKTFNVTDVDGLFTSSRDHQPYVIIYGKPTGPPGPAGAPVIVYEQQGVEGKRYVASSLGAVEEVDEAKFHQLVPGK